MLKARFHKHILFFRQPAGTSRGVMKEKDSWFLRVWNETDPQMTGIGECSLLKGLSIDDRPGYEEILGWLCENINLSIHQLYEKLIDWPSIRFGLEMALLDLKTGGKRLLFPSPFITGDKPIPINGLVWMGDKEFMLRQIGEKLEKGFRVIKMKVGAIDFNSECELLAHIRQNYSADEIEIRLDANGAFSPEDALLKLQILAKYGIHSIEQPLAAGRHPEMAEICRRSPIPVALDEELIGLHSTEEKARLLDTIQPAYIILKPSLLGGFAACDEWIRLAEDRKIGWWVTSALESNVGLNAIAQWTATLGNPLPQGLGTGSLYSNNIPSPLTVSGGFLHYRPENTWDYTFTGHVASDNPWDLPLTLDGVTLSGGEWKSRAAEWTGQPEEDIWRKDLAAFLTKWYADSGHLVVRTSGSTGIPKEIAADKLAMLHSARATGMALGLAEHPDALLCLSTRYIAGMMMVVRAMVHGQNLVTVPPDGNPLLHLLDEKVPSFAAMVPAQVSNALDHPVSARRLSIIKTLLVGGGEVPEALRLRIKDLPNTVYSTYGMTETLSHIALQRLSGPGKQNFFETLPGIEVSLDERGCLVIDAPGIADLPVVTNDLAGLLNNRSFRWLGRIDHVINRGGKKIIPGDIENKLSSCIKERFFIGAVSDEKWGEVPVLFIESGNFTESGHNYIRNFMERNLPKSEWIARILAIPRFIETDNGKVNRQATIGIVLSQIKSD